MNDAKTRAIGAAQTRYPQPAVVGVVVDTPKRTVLLSRSEWGWTLPGAEFEGGSDWMKEVARQLRAHAGVEAKAPRLVGLYAVAEGDPPRARATACFLVTEFLGQPASGCEWFSVDELPSDLDAMARTRIGDALAFRGDVVLR